MNAAETLWLSMAAYAVGTSITPGPNNTMLLASGVNFGWARTLPHLLGVSSGLFLILLLGALGIQQWLFQVHWLRELVKWLGAIYLVFLAWRLFHAAPPTPSERKPLAKPMTFLQAALFQWVNPKLWAMVFGFFSTYVPAHVRLSEAIALCLVFTCVNLPCTVLVSVIALATPVSVITVASAGKQPGLWQYPLQPSRPQSRACSRPSLSSPARGGRPAAWRNSSSDISNPP